MGRLNIDKGINTSYSGPQIQFNPYKNPNGFFFFFVETGKKILTFIGDTRNLKGPQITKQF